jgi:Secretion system C-terminal sorting domain/PKD-like domain
MKLHFKILFLFLVLGHGNVHSQSLDFFKTLGGTGDDGAYDLAIDTDKSIYVLGWYTGVVDLDPGPGVSNVSGYGDRDIFLAKYDSIGNHIWSFGIGGNGQDEGGDIVLDGTGNVLIAGRFASSIDFDPGVNLNIKASNGDRDFYFAKYTSSGNLLWVNTIGGAGYDDTEDMVVDVLGNIYISGSFQFTVDFDPGAGFATRISNGLDDAYIACYNATGIFNWVKSFGGNAVDDFAGIQLDGLGSIYGVGLFTGTTDFDAGIGVYTVSSLGLADVFIVKYDVLGNFHDVVTCGGIGFDAAYGIEFYNDIVYVTGTFSNGVDFDPGISTAIENSLGSGDIFLCQFDTAFNFNWVNTAGGTGFDMGADVSVDSYGNVIGTGMFRLNSIFQGGLFSKNLVALGDRDIFIDYFNDSGKLLNVFPIGSIGVDNVNTFYFDKNSSALFVSGFIGGFADFDPDTNILTPMNFNGVTDIFYAKYSLCDSVAILNAISGDSLICEGDTVYYSVDSLNSCENCRWTFPLGSLLLDSTGADVLFVAGGQSGVLAVYKANTCLESDTVRIWLTIQSRPLLFVSDSLCIGSVYIFPDGTLGTSDTIQTSYLNTVLGCDSIIITNLKFTQPVLVSNTIAVCYGSGYLFNGINYTASGIYSYTISTPGFCDTTHMLNLSILPPNLTLQNSALCGGDTLWVGFVPHTSTGIYIDTLLSAWLCDSIVISNVNFTVIDTSVTVVGNLYTSNQNNAFYQWYECGTILAPVPNAINQSFVAPITGSYAVVISLNGCVDTSACVQVQSTSIGENGGISDLFTLVPNPVIDYLNIFSDVLIDEIEIWSVDGKRMLSEKVNSNRFSYNLDDWASGFYFIEIKSIGQVERKKFLLQR